MIFFDEDQMLKIIESYGETYSRTKAHLCKIPLLWAVLHFSLLFAKVLQNTDKGADEGSKTVIYHVQFLDENSQSLNMRKQQTHFDLAEFWE